MRASNVLQNWVLAARKISMNLSLIAPKIGRKPAQNGDWRTTPALLLHQEVERSISI